MRRLPSGTGPGVLALPDPAGQPLGHWLRRRLDQCTIRCPWLSSHRHRPVTGGNPNCQPSLSFEVHDFDAPFDNHGQFDVAVFFDALHHSVDESHPLRLAFEALRPGGVCVVCEPGRGHAVAESSRKATENHGVTERDMTPAMIIGAARQAGFRSFEVYPHPQRFAVPAYRHRPTGGWSKQRILSVPIVAAARAFYAATIERRSWGLVRLVK